MKILVAVATRHGATMEIAENIAAAVDSALADAGLEPLVEVRDAGVVHSVEGFDAVVLGSAVYMGHWLEPARKLAETAAAAHCVTALPEAWRHVRDDLRPLWAWSREGT